MTAEVIKVGGTKWRPDGLRWQYQHNGVWREAPKAFWPFLDRIEELQGVSNKARVEIIERLEEALDSVWGRKEVIEKLFQDMRGNAK